MGRFDPVALLESTCTWVDDERAWLEGIVLATRGLELGGGRVAYTLRFDGKQGPPALVAVEDGAPGWPDELARLNAVFSPEASALVHVPLGRVRTHGSAIVAENAARTGLSVAEYMQLAGPAGNGPPLADFVFGGSGRDRVAFVALASDKRGLRPERRQVVEMFVAHFAAMTRLRRAIGDRAPIADADAVFSANGRLLHAANDDVAAATTTRGGLVDAVLAVEKARGALRRRAPGDAMRAWRALASGGYTIVETVERDGKRLVLARRNEPRVGGLGTLTQTEAACVYFTALGHPQKLIAYELGLSATRAARITREAIAKLRLASAAELTKMIAPLLRRPADG